MTFSIPDIESHTRATIAACARSWQCTPSEAEARLRELGPGRRGRQRDPSLDHDILDEREAQLHTEVNSCKGGGNG